MAFMDRSVISRFALILPLILSGVGCGDAHHNPTHVDS